MECNAHVPNDQWLPEWHPLKQILGQWGFSQQCLMFMDGMVVPELLRLLHEARTSCRSFDYICHQINEASCAWTMRLAVPRRIGWRMTATEEERQRYGQVASLPEIKELWGLYTQLGDIVQYWLHEHLALDALALLVIAWQARENTPHEVVVGSRNEERDVETLSATESSRGTDWAYK